MTKSPNKTKAKNTDNTIALNRKARYDYSIEKTLESGISLQGWEVKSLRAGKAQIADSYVLLKNGEAWLLGSVINPIISTCTHIAVDANRTRKLLLHKKEIQHLIGYIERKGYTVIPLKMYWKRNVVKLEIAIAKGKKEYDKRATKRDHDWNKQKQRMLKGS